MRKIAARIIIMRFDTSTVIPKINRTALNEPNKKK